MFSHTIYTIKAGEIVVQDGNVVKDMPGKTLHVAAPYDRLIESAIRDDFERFYTIAFENYPIQLEHYLASRQVMF